MYSEKKIRKSSYDHMKHYQIHPDLVKHVERYTSLQDLPRRCYCGI